MCIIIERPAKVILPLEQFKNCVLNNPDGYGIAVPDINGKMYIERSAEKPDGQELWEALHDDYKNDKVLIHLRYNTAGETSLRNTHPFPVLDYRTDGIDLRMAHNGTIHSYKVANSPESDTRRFVRGFIRPLFKRLIRGYDTEEIMNDPFFVSLISSQIPKTSVLSFMDGHGNTLQVNAEGNGGFYTDNGIYYSNKYSFDPKHREPVSYGYSKSYTQGQHWTGNGWSKYSGPKSVTLAQPSKPQEVAKPAPVVATPGKDISSVVKDKVCDTVKVHALDTKQPYFSEKYELDLDDLYDLSDESIQEIVDNHPVDAKLLIMELLNENQKMSNLIAKKSGKGE